MTYFLNQPGTHSYRMGKKVRPKAIKDKLTRNDFYFFIARSLREELEQLRKAFVNHRKTGHLPEDIIESIERTYGRAMQATHLNFFRGPRVLKDFFKYVDALDTWTSEQRDHLGEKADPHISSDLQKMLAQLFEATSHYIKQCRMMHGSVKPGSRISAPPTNWTVKELIEMYIQEYVPTGKKKFPPYIWVSKKLNSHDPPLRLSERMYRSYRRQRENGVFTHAVQKKRQQVTRVHDT